MIIWPIYLSRYYKKHKDLTEALAWLLDSKTLVLKNTDKIDDLVKDYRYGFEKNGMFEMDSELSMERFWRNKYTRDSYLELRNALAIGREHNKDESYFRGWNKKSAGDPDVLESAFYRMKYQLNHTGLLRPILGFIAMKCVPVVYYVFWAAVIIDGFAVMHF